jgi:hypothetical protein
MQEKSSKILQGKTNGARNPFLIGVLSEKKRHQKEETYEKKYVYLRNRARQFGSYDRTRRARARCKVEGAEPSDPRDWAGGLEEVGRLSERPNSSNRQTRRAALNSLLMTIFLFIDDNVC